MTTSSIALACVATLFLSSLAAPRARAAERWTPEQANAWHEKHGWLVGANFGPSTAINQLEMWQADSFDPKTIDRELKWAHDLGFNSMRVFLHHLLWEQDPDGFLKRLDQYLEISQKHKIGTMFVLFDSVWDPNPKLGKQSEPRLGLHNSGWVQSPGKADLLNEDRHKLLEEYVKGVVGRFKDDPRVVAWDLFNEPDNDNRPAYVAYELQNKGAYSLVLLRKAMAWARAVNPSQPITVAPWRGDWEDPAKLTPLVAFMLDNSDVISFHSYDDSASVERQIAALERYGRPIINTEYMARPRGSTFEQILPIFARRRIGAYNWGFVAGKTQTIYPWDSWVREYTAEPPVWFHDIFRPDGTPYRAEEVALIRSLTGAR